MEDCGMVYVASKQARYVEEAFLSAESARNHFGDVSITLFTDFPQHEACATGLFDSVKSISSVTGLVSPWSEGQLNRLHCLLQTPYKRTLHLDCDTLIVGGKAHELFDLLHEVDVGMVETTPDDSYSRHHYNRPMFNAGLVLFRWNAKTERWLREWATRSERNFRLAGKKNLPKTPWLDHISDNRVRRKLLCMDQISLVEILSPETNELELEFHSLDYSWNYRGSRFPERNRVAPRILHLPRHSPEEHKMAFAAALARIRPHKSQLLGRER